MKACCQKEGVGPSLGRFPSPAAMQVYLLSAPEGFPQATDRMNAAAAAAPEILRELVS